MNWQEVAPAELRFAPRAKRQQPIKIIKRNYLGLESEYRLNYFRHHRDNLELDNANNHITASFVALVADDGGMAVAKDNSIHSNFAFAPMRVHYHNGTDSFSAWVNPFGTYHVHQYRPPTWGNRHGYEVTLLAGEQFTSSGPTYNGQNQQFELLFPFFKSHRLQSEIKHNLISYANPPFIISAKRKVLRQPILKSLPMPNDLLKTDIQGEKGAFSWNSNDRLDIPPNLQIRVAWTNFCRILVNTVTN